MIPVTRECRNLTTTEQEKMVAQNHYDKIAEKYEERYSEDFKENNYNLEYRARIILKRLQANNLKTVFDVGCGTCNPMILFLQNGFRVKGTDFSKQMIHYGKKNLIKHNFNPSQISVADIENKDTLPNEKFDAIVVLGAFPNLLNEQKALTNFYELLNPNGRLFIDLCNSLFGLFSLNKASKDFFLNELIEKEKLPEEIKNSLYDFYEQKCQEPKREKNNWRVSNPRLHNPLTIEKELLEPNKFKVEQIHFNHFHPMPPIFEDLHPELFRKLGNKMEQPNYWKGYFMASAFIVEATKITSRKQENVK